VTSPLHPSASFLIHFLFAHWKLSWELIHFYFAYQDFIEKIKVVLQKIFSQIDSSQRGEINMNTELKTFIDIAFDGYDIVEDVLSKSYFGILKDLVTAATRVPSVISNLSDLQTEIAALASADTQSDLVAYVETKFKNIGTVKAQSILSCVLTLLTHVLQDGLALEAAIKS
jgi:hypothetical protein